MRLSPDRARALFAEAVVARLATVRSDGSPHLVPVCFAIEGDTVYTAVDQKPKRTRDLLRLQNIRAEPRVALMADHYEDDWSRLWWARLDGVARVLESSEEGSGALAALATRYIQYQRRPPAGPVIAIAAEHWSGWHA